jgi:hypothetical protein
MDLMMKKIKIFTTFQDVSALQVEINGWLTQNPDIRIFQTLQSETSTPQGWNLIITFLYEAE